MQPYLFAQQTVSAGIFRLTAAKSPLPSSRAQDIAEKGEASLTRIDFFR
jgi:hypothetical protein